MGCIQPVRSANGGLIKFGAVDRRFVWLPLNPISNIRNMHLCSDSLDFDDVHDLSEWEGAFESMPTAVEKRACTRCEFEQLRFHSEPARAASRLAESA